MKEPHPICLNALYKHGLDFAKMISLTEIDILKVESATRELKPRWFQERHCRITSSVFGKFCKGLVTTAKVKRSAVL